MKRQITTYMILIASTFTISLAQTTSTVTRSFCPDAKFCTEISAGRAFMGEDKECLKANGPVSLAALYKAIAAVDMTGASDTPESALAILNANRQASGQPAVTAQNFHANGILFVAISSANDQKYYLETSAEGNRLNLDLTAALISTASKEVDRRPAVIKKQNPFYRVIALSKQLLDHHEIASWSRAELFAKWPNNIDGNECIFP